MPRHLNTYFAAAILATFFAAPAAAQSCQQVNLPAGFTSGVLEGQVSPEGVVCYSLNMAPHNNNLDLAIAGRNVVFGMNDGVNAVDARQELMMVPQSSNVRITVTQLMRSPQDEAYRLQITFLPPGNE